MGAFARGGLAVIGLLAGVLGLAFLTLVFQYAPLWGTRESFFVVLYTSLTYASLGGAVVGLFPRESTAEGVAGAGGAILFLYSAGIFYYLIFGSGTYRLYLPMVLIVGSIILGVAIGGFKLAGRFFDGGDDE